MEMQSKKALHAARMPAWREKSKWENASQGVVRQSVISPKKACRPCVEIYAGNILCNISRSWRKFLFFFLNKIIQNKFEQFGQAQTEIKEWPDKSWWNLWKEMY